MKYALLDSDNYVIQTGCKKRDGFVLCPNYVCAGYKKDDENWISPEPSDNTPETEYFWAKSELELADIEINKHLDSDENAIATESEWRTYRKELRAYATVNGGVYSYSGERPISPA